MVRLSQIVKPNLQPPERPVRSGTQPEAPLPQQTIVSHAVPRPFPPFSPASASADEPEAQSRLQESRLLYSLLLAECQRCLNNVQDQQRLTLGELPTLIERLVERVLAEDAELLRLSTMGESTFTLARHGVNVSILAVQVGAALGLKPLVLGDLSMAALLHDIGMTRVGHLLNVPHVLNAEQVQELREHPLWGERIAQRCTELPPIVREVIAQEHERIDGSGYPRRLVGRDIEEHAQIVGLLDIYEALTHDRPYRQRLVPAEATRVVAHEHRRAFHRELLRAFLQAVPVYPVGSWVRLTTGELAQVIATRREKPLMPTVSVRFNRDHQSVRAPMTVDLTADPRMAVVEAIPEPTAVR